jgi:hypothetical protein
MKTLTLLLVLLLAGCYHAGDVVYKRDTCQQFVVMSAAYQEWTTAVAQDGTEIDTNEPIFVYDKKDCVKWDGAFK